MKYVITESRLEETITNYFDEIFDVDNIHYTVPYEYNDDTGEEGDDDTRMEFYIGDYENDDTCFRWYSCDYFTPDSYAKDICPTVSLEYKYENTLNGFFGDDNFKYEFCDKLLFFGKKRSLEHTNVIDEFCKNINKDKKQAQSHANRKLCKTCAAHLGKVVR